MADVEMEKTALDDATERKKALLVYKSNLQSASDDDASDDDEEEDVKSNLMGPPPPVTKDEVDEMDVDEDEEGGVQMEKDDDESLNAPSDDDLDSTATPRRSETDEDDDLTPSSKAPSPDMDDKSGQKKTPAHSETESNRAPSPSPSNASTQHVDDSTTLTLKSGTSNVGAIIAARRRTVARKECEVCHEPRNGRRALLCVQCKCMYHSSCFRQQFPKLVQGSSTRQWYCPECETVKPVGADKPPINNTPRKQQRSDSSKSRAAKSSSTSRPEDRTGVSTGVTGTAAETEVQRLTDLALRGSKSINAMILEQTGEMLHISQALTKEINSVMGSNWLQTPSSNNNVKHEQHQLPTPSPPPFLLVPTSSSTHASSAASAQIVATNDPGANNGNTITWDKGAATEKDILLRRVHNGLDALKQLLEQLQVAGIQFEVDFIKEVRATPNQDRKQASSGARKSQATGTGGRSASGSKGKSGASRLYSSQQIQKLEEWYQRSSRPESSEIHSMYRIINCPEYADPELQPEGISVKQIRIWFDNRRAKERLDYMRLKMKDISTTDMDADSVKKMKAAYIDEAKEVLEARVSRMRENGQGSGNVVDEADMALIANTADQPMHGRAFKPSPSSVGKVNSGSVSGAGFDKPPTSAGFNAQKKRIRIDYVASVRKAIKDARDAGKSEEETKTLRTAAIERARERLHVPYKNARTGPSKPLGKDEVSHIKLKMLKLLEEDAPAEELTDIIELLLSLIIPHAVLVESGLQRQLELVLIAHKDNKELVRQTKKLQEEFQSIEENGDAPNVMAAISGETNSGKKRKEKSRSLLLSVDTESLPGTPGSSPSSGPTPSPESRRPRVKFSLAQLVKLEKYFHKEDTPSKKKLDKIAARLNAIASADSSSDSAQRSIDYKQIRCWFYKRRSANQPPQALSGADLNMDDAASSSSNSSDTESDDEKLEKGSKSRKSKPKASTSTSGGSSKRKAPLNDDQTTAKRQKNETSSAESVITGVRPVENKEAASIKSDDDSAGSIQTGRIFNVKQLATIIEEYEKNPRPSVTRLEELQKVLNQDEHTVGHSGNVLGVTKQQIKTWFSNRRAKERLDLIKMKIKETRGVTKALYCASTNGNIDVVSLLLERGADMAGQDFMSRMALHFTAGNGHSDVVTFLLDRGADMAAQDMEDRTTLHYAANNGHRDVILLLLERGANVAAQDKEDRTALHYAAGNGHSDVVTLLLDRGADMAAQTKDGETALNYAIRSGQRDTLSLLLERGANVAAQDKDDWTALHYACKHGHRDVVSLLLEWGADVDAQTRVRITVLLYLEIRFVSHT
ncbi:Homebox and aldo/keto reductase [Phytophthora megakarya]|uniref:Homebox and aldo/keto reductase n=1 Tax=Phytophthora megakarya TaxID=4795 RepID=A0A225W9I0_9STRA|nr:Homebox and aldo/keto reductase [Phytophthora megakarya]